MIKMITSKIQSQSQNSLLSSYSHQFIIVSQHYQRQSLYMDESQRFSFGDVEDTIYVTYEEVQTTTKLSYNPFSFDLKLAVYKSKPNYQQPGIQYPLSKSKKTIFCRKKKIQKQWKDDDSTPIYLMAEIISQKHFSISQNYVLSDENSKHGTFIWINKENPLKIQINDIFWIAKQPFHVTNIQKYPKQMLQFKFQGKPYCISESKKLFLIGSHKICDIVVPNLYQFQICINLANYTIFTYLDEEESSTEHGLWYKLRNDNKKQIKLQHGSLILVEPYIFRVSS